MNPRRPPYPRNPGRPTSGPGRRHEMTPADLERLAQISPELAQRLRATGGVRADGVDEETRAALRDAGAAALRSLRDDPRAVADMHHLQGLARQVLEASGRSRPELYREFMSGSQAVTDGRDGFGGTAEDPDDGHEDPGSGADAALGDDDDAPHDVVPPAAGRGVEDFFAGTEVRIRSVDDYLERVALLQRKNWDLGLIWRGHGNAAWNVRSSLSRVLSPSLSPASEAALRSAEDATAEAAKAWDPHLEPTIGLLAELQHAGAPTRLIDVSTDPDIAMWFAVENPADDASDARLLAWASEPPGEMGEADTAVNYLDEWFWHEWTGTQQRIESGWGTGVKTWWWLPPSTNERLRAQRGGFLLEAEPIVSADIAGLFSERLGATWSPREISDVTSVLGLPSPHDRRAEANEANIVPLYSFRVDAAAKPELRDYLAAKGLTDRYIYPDQVGLVRHLNRALPRLG